MSPELPAWFTEAIGHQPDRRVIEVDDVPIAYRAWGAEGDPVVVLVHGGAAHSGWWDHIGPHLAQGARVVALDLSGHGDSGWRSEYGLEGWSAEVMAVAAAESTGPPRVFGHSMGGFVALHAAVTRGEQLAGAMALDSPVRETSSEVRAWLAQGARRLQHQVWSDRETLIARFRTLPADTATVPFVQRHIAEQSVREVDGGWRWKFDPRIFLQSRMEPDELAAAACPVALFRGERGMATSDITDDVARRLSDYVPVTVIPDAGHHLMLDQPVAVVAAMQTLIGEWRRPT